ncbi:MAG: hypothetical protein KAW92_10610 [Candidatus Cloacimonetes bacterium]|nr:hypothetical protein [Candidatus Cloacimonadota bacterium]
MATKNNNNKKPATTAKKVKVDHSDWITMYNDGFSTGDIAKKVGKSQPNVRMYLVRHGVKMRTGKETVALKKQKTSATESKGEKS